MKKPSNAGKIIWRRKYDVTNVGLFFSTYGGKTDNDLLKHILVYILFNICSLLVQRVITLQYIRVTSL